MGEQDSKRIWHDIAEAPTTFRSGRMNDILDELSEEDAGQGFNEVIKSGVFVSKIVVWTDSSKTKKRTETTITRTGVFVSSIVKQYYDNATGLSVVASVNATMTRNADNSVKDVTVTRTRP